jgi:nitroimidazol reductase NimA-like FMN-containing flavoprotein (pyridoxamine 5'-phosphate oxidase superfamily)
MIGKLSLQEIDEVLYESKLGRIGCSDGTKTYIVPISFVYDGKFIVAHSVDGMKIRMMRANPNVCFEVEEVKNHVNWKTVIAWGRFEEITNELERYEGMKLFVDRMMKLKISATAQPPEISEMRVHPHQPGSVRPIIYRIRIEEKTGRYEKS